MLTERSWHQRRVERLLREHPVVGILGPRQTGKTTLAHAVADYRGGSVTVFDLEDPRHVRRLQEPTLELEPLRGLVVIDEIQRRPELFPILRVLADRPRTPARFLVLGSASPELLRQGSESLAGRVAFHELTPFDVDEVGADRLARLWFRGGFPRSFLAKSERAAEDWRREFIRTFLERDLAALGASLPSPALDRFWRMLAHWHGQVWNASEFARSFAVSHTTVTRYVDLLAGAFVVRQLRPWFENLGKRLVKSPKVYIADSGLLHTLLGVGTPAQLRVHPKTGASWEGFLLAQVVARLHAHPDECWFYATHGGAELDLLVVAGGQRRGFEFKLTDNPTVTASMRVALDDLKLDSLDVIHAGRDTYPLAHGIRAVAAASLVTALKPVR